MDIFDVRLAQVMTGGLNNVGLRSLANGRHTVWESFKVQTGGHYCRDLDASFGKRETTKNMFPGQDPYLWDNRYMAIKELAKELAKVVAQKGPSAANQSMLQQIQELQRENARFEEWESPSTKFAHLPKGLALPKARSLLV